MRTATVIVGAGHAGLAMSSRLTERSIDHVVLERGAVASSWRTGRRPGLRLLTPNRQLCLPSFSYDGPDPDGFMSVSEVGDLLTRYAAAVDAPVLTETAVLALRRHADGYELMTTQGPWVAPTVVIASGACVAPQVPPIASAVPSSVTTTTPATYPGAEALPEGGVLIVGAGATGVQLAEEIHCSGRPVTLAAGRHVRLPRTYRGRDIFSWLDDIGVMDERFDTVDGIGRARRAPSPQLIGSGDRRQADLNALGALGVRIVGRLERIDRGDACFSGSLGTECELADDRMNRFLDSIDALIGSRGERPVPTRVPGRPERRLDLRSGEIRTVVWATGYRSAHRWVQLPVFDRLGQLRHEGGVVSGAGGLYVLGMPFLRRRRSSFITGATADTQDLAALIRSYLSRRACGFRR